MYIDRYKTTSVAFSLSAKVIGPFNYDVLTLL